MSFTPEDFGDKSIPPLTMTQADLDAIRARAEAATSKEEWVGGRTELSFSAADSETGTAAVWYDDGDLCAVVHDNPGLGVYDPTPWAALFACARTDIPALLTEIETLRRACYHYATQMGRWWAGRERESRGRRGRIPGATGATRTIWAGRRTI